MLDNILAIPALAVGAFFAVSYFISPDTIVIQQISVPPALEDRGYTAEVATVLLSDKIAQVTDEAGTNRGAFIAEGTAQAKSVEALSDWFGLAQPIRATQVALGFLPYSFSGEVVEEGDDLVLHIRGQSPAYWNYRMTKRVGDGDVHALMQSAAVELMRELDPYLVAVRAFRADIRKGEYTETKRSIDHALVYAPRSNLPWVYALWAHVLHLEGDDAGAIMKNRQALALDPTFPRPMMRWGEILASMGRHDEAIGRFKKTLEIDPHYPEAIVFWARSLIAQGKMDEARRKYEQAYAMAPNFPRIVRSYAQYLAEYGNKVKAADIMRRAVELTGGQQTRYVRELREIQREIEPSLREFPQAAEPSRHQ